MVPLFIWDPAAEGAWGPGAASRWWLDRSLRQLDAALTAAGSRLIVRSGNTEEQLDRLLAETGATGVFWNRRYEPAAVARDTALKADLRERGIRAHSSNAALLFEPWTIATREGNPYRVFTPFARACREAPAPPTALGLPSELRAPPQWPSSLDIADLGLAPSVAWDAGLQQAWAPGARGARALLDTFVDGVIGDYLEDRDRPDRSGTSRLSPHVHFGELSVRAVWHEMAGLVDAHPDSGVRAAAAGFQRQLLWREFAHHLLFHFPGTTTEPLRAEFSRFPWQRSPAALEAWQRGRTGFPIVDAGMRQLWLSGWMHNRVRMLVGSFLVKDLLLHWRAGAEWFWDTLVDADLANNTMGWQWVAGSGADAAPYFRVFNPVLQGEKFDPSGDYVRTWVPELAALPKEWIHRPFEAPAKVLAAAGVTLGGNYPFPMVDHALARQQALAAYQALKGNGSP